MRESKKGKKSEKKEKEAEKVLKPVLNIKKTTTTTTRAPRTTMTTRKEQIPNHPRFGPGSNNRPNVLGSFNAPKIQTTTQKPAPKKAEKERVENRNANFKLIANF